MTPENGAWAGNLLNMENTGVSDRHRGTLYRCLGCGERFWTCFGHARRHECDGEPA